MKQHVGKVASACFYHLEVAKTNAPSRQQRVDGLAHLCKSPG